jgi:hypothetical protein
MTYYIFKIKKIYRFNANNSCFFSISRLPKKSNSSNSFKDKISGLYKLISLFLVALQAKHYDNTIFHILKQSYINKQINKKRRISYSL